MKSIYIAIISLSFIGMLSLVVGCKPSEKNYRTAYEIAKLKDKEGIDSLTYALMESEKLPRWRYVGGDSARVITLPLKLYLPDTARISRYNVAVGCYGMLTNAMGHYERLRNTGENVVILSAPKDMYYVISAQFDSIPRAADYVRKLESSKVNAVGMPCITVLEPLYIK